MPSASARWMLMALVATLFVGVAHGNMKPADAESNLPLDGPSVPGRLLRELELSPSDLARTALSTLQRSFPSSSAVVFPRGDDACCKCVGETARHIIDSTYAQIQAACSNVTCPVIQKECKWIEDHEQRYKGFLVARIRPASLGFSYCMGTGDCAHPNFTQIAETVSDKIDPTYLAMQVETLVGKVVQARSWNKTSTDRNVDFSAMIESEPTREAAPGEAKDPCLRRAVKWVTKHAIESFIRHCKKTECPWEKKVCAFANKHRDLTHGYIYGKVEPWKFAIGYCAGRRHDNIAQE